MYNRCIMELSIVRLEVTTDRIRKAALSHHMLVSELVWPRPSIALRSNAVAVTLRRGTAEWETGNWSEGIQFKEIVEGPFGLRCTLTDALGNREWQRLAGTLGGALTRMLNPSSDIPAALLAIEPLRYLYRTAATVQGIEVPNLGEGRVEMNADKETIDGQWRMLETGLTAAQDVHRTRRTGRAADVKTRREKIVSRGDCIGRVVLAARFVKR